MLPSFASFIVLPQTPRFATALGALAVALALSATAVHAIAASAFSAGLRTTPVRIDALGSAESDRVDALERALRAAPFVTNVTRVRRADALADASGGSADIARLVAAYPVANPFPDALMITLRSGGSYDDLLALLGSGEYDDVLGDAIPSIRAQAHNARQVLGVASTASRATLVVALLAVAAGAMLLAAQFGSADDVVVARRSLLAVLGIGCGVFALLLVIGVLAFRGLPVVTGSIGGIAWRAGAALIVMTAWPLAALFRPSPPAEPA